MVFGYFKSAADVEQNKFHHVVYCSNPISTLSRALSSIPCLLNEESHTMISMSSRKFLSKRLNFDQDLRQVQDHTMLKKRNLPTTSSTSK